MTSTLSLVFIGIALAVAAHGGSEVVIPPAADCSPQDQYFAMGCYFKMRGFAEQIMEVDANNKDVLEEIQKSCDVVDHCFEKMCKDLTTTEELKSVKNRSNAYCGVFNYLANNFKDCSNRLEAKKSKCFDDWTPFLTIDEQLNEKKVKEACTNFFGKDQCMLKEITETCGKREWEGLRDNFIKIDEDIMKKCSLRKLFA